jgi:hypothetical protein
MTGFHMVGNQIRNQYRAVLRMDLIPWLKAMAEGNKVPAFCQRYMI